MNAENRRSLLAASVCTPLVVILARACFALPHFGESRGALERLRAIAAVASSHATNLDAFVNFDFRGFDTLGEEFIFFVAVAGFSLILRERRGELTEAALPPVPGRNPRDRELEVRLATRVYVPIAIVYGLYIVVHGQLTPGGGFQGGVALATAFATVALGLGFAAFRRLLEKETVEAIEAVGTLSYVAIGCGTLVASGVFLRNALPHGDTGALLSSGTILALNDGVAVAVAAGFIVLFGEFLGEMVRQK